MVTANAGRYSSSDPEWKRNKESPMKTVKDKFYPSITDRGLTARSIMPALAPLSCAHTTQRAVSPVDHSFSFLFLFLRCIFLIFGDNLIRLKVHEKESEDLKFNFINWAP